MATTLKFGTDGNWATKKGSTLAYNSENGNFKPLPFTFDRSTSATRVNKQGLIEVVSNNEPRIDFLNDSKGALLLEPQRTNSYRNGVLGGAVVGGSLPTNWSIGNSAGLTTSVVGIGTEKGLSYVDVRFQGVLTSSTYIFASGAITEMAASPSTAYNHSMYISLVGGGDDGLIFRPVIIQRDSSGSYISEYSDVISVTSTLNKQDITLESSVALTAYIQPRFYITGFVGQSVDLTLRFAAFQLEAGSYATSYIPTQGSIGTRVAESCNQTPPSGIIGQTEGTIYLDTVINTDVNGLTRISLSAGVSSSNWIFFSAPEVSGGDVRTRIFINNGGNLELNLYGGFLTSGRHKIALAYKENDVVLYVDGVLDLSNNSASIPSTDKISLTGSSPLSINADRFNEHKEVKLYNTRLSNAELQALTTI